MGPAGPAGSDGADGADGSDGPMGPTGPVGPVDPQGLQGPAGILQAGSFVGSVSSQTGLGYRFIGGTTSVTADAGQRLIAAGTASLATDGAEFLFRLDVCYQNITPPGHSRASSPRPTRCSRP